MRYQTNEEHAKQREEQPEGILPLAGRILATEHFPNGTKRHRSFGFHHPQKPRVAKVQHPKPERPST